MEKPKKEDFDSLPSGGAYKKLEGNRQYNSEMYEEALKEWELKLKEK